MNKENYKIYTQIAMVIILLGEMLTFGVILKDYTNKGRDCQANPFVFGANQVTSKSGGKNISCNCLVSGGGIIKSFSFDKNSMTATERFIYPKGHK